MQLLRRLAPREERLERLLRIIRPHSLREPLVLKFHGLVPIVRVKRASSGDWKPATQWRALQPECAQFQLLSLEDDSLVHTTVSACPIFCFLVLKYDNA